MARNKEERDFPLCELWPAKNGLSHRETAKNKPENMWKKQWLVNDSWGSQKRNTTTTTQWSLQYFKFCISWSLRVIVLQRFLLGFLLQELQSLLGLHQATHMDGGCPMRTPSHVLILRKFSAIHLLYQRNVWQVETCEDPAKLVTVTLYFEGVCKLWNAKMGHHTYATASRDSFRA